MNVHLLGAPVGFTAAVSTLNEVSEIAADCARVLVEEAFEFESHGIGGTGGVDVSAKRDAFKSNNVDITIAQVQSVINTIGYIYRGADKHLRSEETGGSNEEEYFRAIGKALEINTELNNACLEIIARAWADSRAAELTAKGSESKSGSESSSSSSSSNAGAGGVLAKPKESFSIGQLVSLDWTLGMSMASSQCDSLLCPFVRLTLQVADADGAVQTQNVELTYDEFQKMARTFKDVAAKLERL